MDNAWLVLNTHLVLTFVQYEMASQALLSHTHMSICLHLVENGGGYSSSLSMLHFSVALTGSRIEFIHILCTL